MLKLDGYKCKEKMKRETESKKRIDGLAWLLFLKGGLKLLSCFFPREREKEGDADQFW